jgi:hypothetical protein
MFFNNEFIQPRPRPFIFIIFLIFSAFSHEKTGLGDLRAGRRMRKRKNIRPSGFPNNKVKTALKLPWL